VNRNKRMLRYVRSCVMAGLVPAIHVDKQEIYLKQGSMRRHVDARVKHGHDELNKKLCHLNELVRQ
jgi:hypothetical protein